jgi:excisionase family DNA binding protein
MQKLIPLSTVALNLGIKPETLRRKVRTGQISAYKLGKSWRFSENSIELFLKDCLSSTENCNPGGGKNQFAN